MNQITFFPSNIAQIFNFVNMGNMYKCNNHKK